MYKTDHACLAFLAILVLMSGCRDSGPESDVPTTSKTPLIAATAGSVPAFESPFESPLQPSATPIATCLSLIELSGNTVCGYVVSEIDGRPVAGRPVYLAEALFSNDGSVVLSSLDQNAAPQAITDENGLFYMIDIPSNMYFLMVDEYPQPIMLKEAGNPANDLFVDWREESGSVDLGTIPANVPSLPIP